ncbi:MAG: hypothetical protein F4018_09690 [Acidobacteria bacterium]|nr:hypothetical protein [Acidobacteriota bacterium]MYK88579.1 hypothetical protein [Acidobacteriota bacterium]
MTDRTEPIRIFIGTDETQGVPTAVLKHSILSRTAADVEIRELRDLRTGLEDRFYTGFSFYRWGIPAFCDYTGRALYLDADIVVLCDIRELWEMPLGEHSHLCRPRPAFRFRRWRLERLGGAYASVMLIDCERARWDFRAWCERAARDPRFYKQVMWCLPGSETSRQRGDLPRAFNDLDDHAPHRTRILHYTDLPNQPWKKVGHRHEHVFRAALRAACKAGALDVQAVRDDVARGVIHDRMVGWCTEDDETLPHRRHGREVVSATRRR